MHLGRPSCHEGEANAVCLLLVSLSLSLSLSLFFLLVLPPLFPFFIHVASRLVIVGKWSVA